MHRSMQGSVQLGSTAQRIPGQRLKVSTSQAHLIHQWEELYVRCGRHLLQTGTDSVKHQGVSQIQLSAQAT